VFAYCTNLTSNLLKLILINEETIHKKKNQMNKAKRQITTKKKKIEETWKNVYIKSMTTVASSYGFLEEKKIKKAKN
jgi:hypothetical protein